MTHARFPRAPPHPQASPPLWLTAGGLPALQASHTPVSFAGWSWRVHGTKPKPPAGCLAVLWMLGSRMDAGYGCGFASLKVLAEDAAVGEATAKRPITWPAVICC